MVGGIQGGILVLGICPGRSGLCHYPEYDGVFRDTRGEPCFVLGVLGGPSIENRNANLRSTKSGLTALTKVHDGGLGV
jgi:hypothetical protein